MFKTVLAATAALVITVIPVRRQRAGRDLAGRDQVERADYTSVGQDA